MRFWKNVPQIPWPVNLKAGSVKFKQDTIRANNADIPIRVRRSLNGVILVEFPRAGKTMVALSKSCITLLTDDCLVGFLVRL